MDDTRQTDELRVADDAVEPIGSHAKRAAHFAAPAAPRHFRESPVEQSELPEAEPAEPRAEGEAVPAVPLEAVPEERVVARRPGAHFSPAPQAVAADAAETRILATPEPVDADATVLMPADADAGADADATVLMTPEQDQPADAAQGEAAHDAPTSWEGMYVIEEDYPSARPVPYVPEASEGQSVDKDATEPFFVAMDPNFEMNALRVDAAGQPQTAVREKRASRDTWAWVKPTLRPLGLAAALALLIWGGVTFSHSWQRGGETSPAATTDAAVEVTQRENKPLTALSAQDMAARVPDAGGNAAQPTTTREPAMGEIYGEPIVVSRNTGGNQGQGYGSGYGWAYEPEPEEAPASAESPASAVAPTSPASPTSPAASDPAPSAPETTPAPEPTPSAPEPTPAPESTPPASESASSEGGSAPASEPQAVTEF